MTPDAHIVFCHSKTLLLKEASGINWRRIQDRYEDYIASLGPWDEATIAEYFASDYGADDDRWPFSRTSLASFFAGESTDLELSES